MSRPAVRVEGTRAIPARKRIASTGSARAPAASGLSSRSAAKTARGACRTSRVRSHQSRVPDVSVGVGNDLAIVAAVLDLAEAVVVLCDRRPAVAADRVLSVPEGGPRPDHHAHGRARRAGPDPTPPVPGAHLV